jgi:hypothetical protein
MKKMKIWQALAVAVAIISLSVACDKKDDEISIGFDIAVPDNWVHYIYGTENLVYAGERQSTGNNDTIREYMLVYREPLSGYNLNTYFTAIKSDVITSDFYVSTLLEKDTTINGYSSKKFICNEMGDYIVGDDTSHVSLTTTRYFFFEKDYGYLFGLVTVDTTYYRVKPIFDDIITSLQFTD